ncbi:type II secretion system protein E [Rubrobacter xylanophilus]|uniref:Type II secretion system protein E n=2 Tax=Rubrobacter xylanophilus TaxID=49319 RepID=A0A510HF93_9ACTN|nr:type II secretion system protein E [Rubrobacter xylanophilus]
MQGDEKGAMTTRTTAGGEKNRSVWSLLLSEGRLTEEQLHRAVEAQRHDPRDLGQILVSLGYISAEDLARARARRLGLGYLEPSERDVDPAALGLVPEKVLRRHRALPLRIEGGRLVAALADPTDLQALDDLRMLSGHPVTPVVATEEAIRRLQIKLFAVDERVSGLLREAASGDERENDDLDLGAGAGAEERPIIRLVSSILQQAISDGASDIHLEPHPGRLAVRVRVDGLLRETMSIPRRLQSGVVSRLKLVSGLDIAERRLPQDGRFSVRIGEQKVDFRVASLPTVHGEKLVLRLLDNSHAAARLPELGLSPELYRRYEEVFRRPYGAVLVTGPTGSGKSTTLYATLAELNSPQKNIITVEDPVEYRIEGINQIQVNPRIGLSFASALRSILRSDPDIVMIGEIRDHETAKIAVESALTGHLVLATLHTSDAPGALTRLTDMGVEPFLTASAVDCVIAQRLARRLCERCRKPQEPDRKLLENIGFPFELLSGEETNFHQAVGCEWCGGTGYRGRIGIYELMLVDEVVGELVLRRASTAEISRAAEAAGMVRLREDALLKAARGITTVEEALRTVV